MVGPPPQAQLITSNRMCAKDFELHETLGTGAFGRVRFVRHIATGQYYALKMLKKQKLIKAKQVDHIKSERAVLSQLDHPFIVNLHGSFHDECYIYMVLEYITGGEFFSHLRKAKRLSHTCAGFYAAQVTVTFEYLHGKNIIYRDLKPENILLCSDGYLKLTDFGFAKILDHGFTYTLCGTPEYLAPEVLQNRGHGKPVDWWTLGILTYEMLVGAPPFMDKDPMGIYQKILSGKIYFHSTFDRDAKHLIRKLLTADVAKRYGNLERGVDDIKEHGWFLNFPWEALLARQVAAPFRPKVRSETDTSNFDDYPDSDQKTPAVPVRQDPFASWF